MKAQEFLTEARRGSVILVDFQPAYATFDPSQYDPAIQNAVNYINKKQPQVTAFFNGMDVGIEDMEDDVFYHYVEHGLDENLGHLFTFKEKSYAWLRSWMDQGVSNGAIIKTVRAMVTQHLNDSRELFSDEEDYDYAMEHFLGGEYQDWMSGDGIYIPDISLGDLKALNGSLIGGGGKDECLRELELFMNAFNIKYKEVPDWIYG